MKILIADDDRITRALVKRVVGRSGTTVLESENGFEALGMIESEDPDVLITDLRMPVCDGFELIAALRASPAHTAIPIICLSGVNERQDIARLASMGITDYVLKPPQPAELWSRLERIGREQSCWKTHRATRNAVSLKPGLLLIDPDGTFRASVRVALASAFEVIEAASGSDGLRWLRSQPNMPAAVLVGERLQLLPAGAIPSLIHRIAAEAKVAPPTILLIITADAVEPELVAKFDGTIQRSLAGAELLAAVNGACGAAAAT